MDLQAVGDGVGAHRPGGAAGGEHDGVLGRGVLALPEPQCGDGGRPERGDPPFAPLAVPEHVGAGPVPVKATFPVLKNPANRHRAVGFTYEQWHYAFTNTTVTTSTMPAEHCSLPWAPS
nr:hypothetical protein [Frankia sp. Cas3]